MKPIYELLFQNLDTNIRLAFFTDDLKDAEARGKRMLDAEKKQGHNAGYNIVQLPESTPRELIGKTFNLIEQPHHD
jgi:hypothetical protein